MDALFVFDAGQSLLVAVGVGPLCESCFDYSSDFLPLVTNSAAFPFSLCGKRVKQRLNADMNKRVLLSWMFFFPCGMGGVDAIFIELVLITTHPDLDLAELASERELDPATAEDVQWKTAALLACLGCYASGACKNSQVRQLRVVGLQGKRQGMALSLT